jgi:hypothetical protein
MAKEDDRCFLSLCSCETTSTRPIGPLRKILFGRVTLFFFSTFIYPSSSVDAFARSEEEFLSTTLFIHISASMYDMIMPFYKTIRASLATKEDILPVVLSPMAMCLTSQNTHGILRNRIERLDVCQA